MGLRFSITRAVERVSWEILDEIIAPACKLGGVWASHPWLDDISSYVDGGKSGDAQVLECARRICARYGIAPDERPTRRALVRLYATRPIRLWALMAIYARESK